MHIGPKFRKASSSLQRSVEARKNVIKKYVSSSYSAAGWYTIACGMLH